MIKKLTLFLVIIILLVASAIQVKSLRINIEFQPTQAPPTTDVRIVLVKTTTEYDIEANYTILLQLLRQYELVNTTAILEYSALEDADVLVLLGPTTLNDIDVNVVKQFVREGGSILLLLPSSTDEIEPLLDVLGISVLGKAVDNTSYYIKNTTIVVNSSYMLEDNCIITSKFGNVSEIAIPDAVGFEFDSNKSDILNVSRFTYKLIWGTNNTFADENGNLAYDEGEPRGENVTLLLALELWWGSRIAIVSSSKIFTDITLANTTKYDNMQLLINLVKWIGFQVNYLRINIEDGKSWFLKDERTINLSFNITDDNEKVVTDVKSYAVITLLNTIVFNTSAVYNETSGKFEVELDLSNITKTAIYYLYILAFKEGYGFFWKYVGKVVIEATTEEPDNKVLLIAILGFGVPTVVSIFGIVSLFNYYLNIRKSTKEVEKKILEQQSKK